MGSSQSALGQQVVNTIEQFGYPATVFKFFSVIGIIAGVSIIALAIWRHKKALDVSAPLRAAQVLRKAAQQDSAVNMPGPDHHRQQPRCHHRRLHQRRLLPSTRTLEQWAFFLLIILPLYTTIIWCLLSRPIRTSLLQFTMETMVWLANPIPSIMRLHNENMATSYADGRTLTSQPILPASLQQTH